MGYLRVVVNLEMPKLTAAQLFQIVNPLALLGWIVLIASILLKKPVWRDQVAGRFWPLGFAVLYSALIIFFFFKAPGGFDTLANVQLLFTSQWAALAGWVHYLAFDLFVGCWIVREVMARGMSRLLLIPLLPLTFMFGPIGFLGLELSKLLFQRQITEKAVVS
jgi:Domain of unknown function (DUF4281)